MPRIKHESHPLLPADAPKDQPHILDIEADDDEIHDSGHILPGDARLCDYVATVLHHLEGHADALRDFFNPEIKSFKFLRIEKIRHDIHITHDMAHQERGHGEPLLVHNPNE